MPSINHNLKIYIASFAAIFIIVAVIFGYVISEKLKDNKTSFDLILPATYDQPIKITLGGQELLISPLGNVTAAKAAIDENNSNITRYIDAFKNTDIVQTKSANKLKEDIILKQPGHPAIFEYQINVQPYDIVKEESGNIVFYQKGKAGDELAKLFTIPAPYLIDADGQKSSLLDVETSLSNDGRLALKPSQAWLAQAKYPVTLDPTVEISILNLHSHPQQGENWTVEFTTQGRADLKIIPNDQATIDDDEFVSLSCGGEKRQPQILAGDVIFYPNWSCLETATVIHYTKKAGKHALRFEFGDQVAFAYNSSSHTETLRPNGAGSETMSPSQFPNSTFHWDKVDEVTPDDNTTYVYNENINGGWGRDLYGLPAHTGSGTINSVTVYARLKDDVGSVSSGKISIKTNGTTYDTSAYALTTSWADKSNAWATNPQTTNAWTWDEIDALEAGVSLYYYSSGGPSILGGQPILMADGSQKNIEDVRVGDEIISFNLDSHRPEKDKVVGLGGGPHDDYLVFNGTLKASLNHVIWVNGEYKPAEDIKIGEFLTNSEGQEVEVTQIQYVLEKVDTYDLTVEKNHNFFANNYLVHNLSNSKGMATQVYVVVDYTPVTQINTPLSGRFKDSSLVGYWSFDGANMGTTSATDLSGNSNTGWLNNGVKKVPGINGQALSFDGVNDYVDVSNESNFDFERTQAFSGCAWVNPSNTSDSYHTIISKIDTSVTQIPGWELTLYGGSVSDAVALSLVNDVRSGTRKQILVNTTAGTIVANKWQQICFTYTGSSAASGVILYIDSIPMPLTTVYDSLTASILNNKNARIGGRATRSHRGLIDEVRIYNRALSAAEVQEQYRAGAAEMRVDTSITKAGPQSGLVGNWTFNGPDVNNVANAAYDRSSSYATGTMVNMATSSRYAIGVSGQALSFDGVDDVVSIDDNGTILDFNQTSKYTWSSWIKNASTISGTSCFLSKDASAGKSMGFNLCLNQTGNTADVVICKGNISRTFDCSGGLGLSIPTNEWNNIIITYDGASNWGIYRNGNSMGTTNFAVVSDTSFKYFIGAGVDTNTNGRQVPEYFFKGLLDEVRVYNRALSADEIQVLYQAGLRGAVIKQ